MITRKIFLLNNFSITGPVSIESLGIHTRMYELEAARGLCVRDDMEEILEQCGKLVVVKHRLENRGRIPLEIIEVQVGEYLGEDDIERFEDDYGRE